MPVIELYDREIVQNYIEKGEIRSSDLDVSNSAIHNLPRYIGLGSAIGGGSLFYLARRYQRRWTLPTFLGVVSGLVSGPIASAILLENHWKTEGRDPQTVIQTLSKISDESTSKLFERVAATGAKHSVSESQHNNGRDQSEDTTIMDNAKSNTINEKI
ncbi:hypothetical protein WALSEDRAFT_29995 [Wallemia mellicola CBS 633.66]|uniref:Uncharacterized protein n=1 Tax=Wallemia mellicola (strain ATCC MYA-4683 / CBS 633.66) TaxID=671144 RepID=I4Y7C5_WALMC|nr:hypothetical protein WALSEDRAFT_29995 [Wallemia mellicola CBS 633.66]EIM19867.1 hypothetical protein WALSEDRAFT_29995 [Wallemia mellicola CBS 633.66]|eukprot:XP_006960009.1 hypothetical protein WALSEDRAFT_29995 [Wallemia mellicola CBS 633.66]